MLRIGNSVVCLIFTALFAWILLAPPVAHADEAPQMPILLETGGKLQSYSPSTESLVIGGHSYRIDPQRTRVVLKSAEGQRVFLAGELGDLTEQIHQFQGRPIFFKADAEGFLEMLILNDAFISLSRP